MSKNLGAVSFIVVLACVISFSACNNKSKWEGIIEELDGISVVKNPDEPIFGKIELDLEHRLSIGNETDEQFMFYKVKAVEIDSKDNIYVLDAGNRRIQMFNDSGEYVQTIGKRGQGPGEFENPTDIFLDKEDNLHVLDNRKIISFDDFGHFRKTIPLEIIISEFSLTSQGTIIARVNPAQERKKSLVHINKSGKIIDNYAEYPEVKPAVKKGQKRGSYVIFTAFHDYTPQPRFSPIDDERFVFGYPLEYELNIITYSGNPLLKISKDEKKKTISQEEKDEIIEALETSIFQGGRKWPKGVLEEACKFPSYRPFFQSILVDEKNRIYVAKIMSVISKNRSIDIDVFNEQGYYLYRSNLPFVPAIIRGGDVYEIFSSEETGEIIIKKYKILNWDRIKSEV